MAITRAPRPKKNYTDIHNNVLRDKRLSYRARGVLGRLLSNSDGFSMTSDDLAAEAKEGREAVRAALRELEAAGYIARNRHQDLLGRWVTLTYVFDMPQGKNTEDGFPGTGLSGAKRTINRNIIKAAAAVPVSTETPATIPPKTMDGEPMSREPEHMAASGNIWQCEAKYRLNFAKFNFESEKHPEISKE